MTFIQEAEEVIDDTDAEETTGTEAEEVSKREQNFRRYLKAKAMQFQFIIMTSESNCPFADKGTLF